jgi:hypothetical protein
VLGAAGGIGQPLALLLKANSRIDELSLYDVANTPGVACDLSHISTGAVVKGYLGPQQLDAALQGCDLVFIPAGEQPCMVCEPMRETEGGGQVEAPVALSCRAASFPLCVGASVACAW